MSRHSQKLGLSEAFTDQKLSGRQKLSLMANTVVLLIGICALFGALLHIPLLYTWHVSGVNMHLKMSIALILLSIGFFIQEKSANNRRGPLGISTLACYLGAFYVGVHGIFAYFNNINVSMAMDALLAEDPPVGGEITLYGALGLTLLTAVLLFRFFYRPSRYASLWGIHFPSLLLLNLAAFGLIESWAIIPLYRYLTSTPGSLAFVCFSLAILFSPAHTSPITVPLTSKVPRVRMLLLALMIMWVGTVLWQTIGSSIIVGPDLARISAIRSQLLLDDIVQIIFSTLILGLGLYILGTLEEKFFLVRKLNESFDNHALLATTLSHDLKAPVTTQIHALEMISEGHFGKNIEDERVQRMLLAIIDSNRFALDLVLNLVEMLRYEMKEERFFAQELQIVSLLSEIREELEPVAQRKGQTLSFNSDMEWNETIIADAFGLKRVLYNLVINALHHVGQGGIIEVSALASSHEMLFSVKDNGRGIPPALQKRLFTRFSTGGGEQAISTSSGLGLYISRQIVERHGGRIWVESTENKGTQFFFTIPRVLAPKLPRAPRPSTTRHHSEEKAAKTHR
jgi:signal transduction histidine kinase